MNEYLGDGRDIRYNLKDPVSATKFFDEVWDREVDPFCVQALKKVDFS